MEQWIQQTLTADHFGLSILPAAFLLGILGSVASCCNLAAVGAVAGYAGSLAGGSRRRDFLLVGLFFMIGTILSLAALGAVSGFIGQVTGALLGKYWRLVAGLVMVLFGLAALRLLPFRAPKLGLGDRALGRGAAGAMVYGLAVGGATTACSVCCNPLLPMAVGAAGLKGTPILGAVILAAFALGYSLPLAASLIGIGFGLAGLDGLARWLMPTVRVVSGVLLIAVGFYLLATK